MSKPHEEEWQVSQFRGGPMARVSRVSPAIGQPSLVCRDASQEEARLISAAPDMARGLLAQGRVHHVTGVWHTDVCWDTSPENCVDACRAAEAALKKAGVL